VLAPNKAIDGQAQAALRAIRAALSGNDNATALDVTGHGSAPILDLCRKLVAAGHDPTTPLHAYRNGTVALIVRAIGEAARLRINAYGTGFIPCPEAVTAPPMRPNGSAPIWRRWPPGVAVSAGGAL
jgi:hypothetical protein